MSLTELIIETGIHDAIARKLNEKGKLSKNAIAEGIINNVRKTIIREQLTDPRFYEQMSKLLDDLIKQSRADGGLRGVPAQGRGAGEAAGGEAARRGIPAALHGKPEAIVIYNNLPRILAAATPASMWPRIAGIRMATTPPLGAGDRPAMREQAPAGWKGDQAREAQVLNALFPLLNRDREATLALFELVKNQPGY
jgi:type I restriction enzyme R subunit